jgi:outer membrane protein assembly factor BamA
LEREGYFDASVEYSSAMREVQSKHWSGEEQVITYNIERGDRHKLIGIEIIGNRYFDKELLSSRLQIYKAAFGSRGKFSRRILKATASPWRVCIALTDFQRPLSLQRSGQF